METLLILLVLCCTGEDAFYGYHADKDAYDKRKMELQRTSHCCAQRTDVELGLRKEVCFECAAREVGKGWGKGWLLSEPYGAKCFLCGLSRWECRVMEVLELPRPIHEKDKAPMSQEKEQPMSETRKKSNQLRDIVLAVPRKYDALSQMDALLFEWFDKAEERGQQKASQADCGQEVNANRKKEPK